MVQSARFYGWKQLALLWIILVVDVAFPYYGAGLIGAYMARDLHLNRSALGLSFGIFQWVTALPSPLVAICINKRGVRFTLFAGSIVLCLGALVMASLVRSGLQVDIVFGVVVGAGVVTGGLVATQTAAGRWFEKRKALAISLLYTGPYIGGFIAPPVLNWVIVNHGGNWRAGWGLISVLSLLASALVVLVKERPSDLGQFPDGVSPANPPAISTVGGGPAQRSVYHTPQDWSFAEALRSPALWLLLCAQMGYAVAFGVAVSHGVVHFMDLGHTATVAAFAISIMCLAALAGTLLVAALGDRIEPRLLLCLGSSLAGAGMLLALNATGMASLYFCVILLGAGIGVCAPCVFAIPGNYFGDKAYASILGLICAIGPTAGALAAWGAGYAYSQLGNYRLVFCITGAICFVGSVIALLTTPPIKRLSITYNSEFVAK